MAHIFVAIELLPYFKNENFHFYCSRDISVFGLKYIYSWGKNGSHKNESNIHQNWFFTFFDLLIFFIGGLTKQNILNIHQNRFSNFSIYWAFSFIIIYHIFSFYYYFAPWARKLFVFTNIIDQNYPIQHSRNLFYNIQLLIHHLQLIPHEHLSRLDLIVNTLIPMRTRTTSQIQMTSSPV